MRIELNIDGVQTPFVLGKDGKLTTVKKEKKTGWERVEKGDIYFSHCIHYHCLTEMRDTQDADYFENADYVNDIEIRCNLIKAFDIWKKLLQWQALNDEPVRDIEDCYTFFLDEESINIFHNPYHMIPILSVTFSSYTKAKECLELFRDDLNWLVKNFYFRLDAVK